MINVDLIIQIRLTSLINSKCIIVPLVAFMSIMKEGRLSMKLLYAKHYITKLVHI